MTTQSVPKRKRVSVGSFDENGNFTFKIGLVERSVFKAEVERLKDYLLKIEAVYSTSYDDSDDERVTPSDSRYDEVKYAELRATDDSNAMLFVDGVLRGVVFDVKQGYGREIIRHAFLFDGSVQESIWMGYSTSHSSRSTYIHTISLVKRGEGDAPEEGSYVSYTQSESNPDL